VLTYVCVILINFQAHRDAFIQNNINLSQRGKKIDLSQDVVRSATKIIRILEIKKRIEIDT